MKTLITILFARLVKKRNNKWITNPLKFQDETFNKLLKKAKKEIFTTSCAGLWWDNNYLQMPQKHSMKD